MDAIAGLSFAEPRVLWALILLVPLAILLQQRDRERRKLANRFISERVRGQLLPARSFRPALLILGGAAGILALAGPQLGSTEQTVDAPEAGLVILLDTSLSMHAPDVGTSRLAAARAVIQKVLDQYDGRAGLVVFEGSAEVVSPLTNDTIAISSLLESVGPAELEVPGSNLRLAITAGLELLDRSEIPSAAMLLISDGEHRAEELGDVLERARERNTPIVTVLIGTAEGSTIPMDDGSFLQVSGQTVITSAREEVLSEIARVTGGRFISNPFSEAAISRVEDAVSDRAIVSSRKTRIHTPRDRYQMPLSLALILLTAASLLNRGAE